MLQLRQRNRSRTDVIFVRLKYGWNLGKPVRNTLGKKKKNQFEEKKKYLNKIAVTGHGLLNSSNTG